MANLLSTIKNTINEKRELPFAVYTSISDKVRVNIDSPRIDAHTANPEALI